MSSECVDDESQQWDYLCPQFCDFNATETTDQLKEMDHFFAVDHEVEEQRSSYGEEVNAVINTPIIDSKTQSNSVINGFKDPNEGSDDFKYETPPQNKENFEEEDDNEVFYSTKKYFSGKKYKLRSTPMRTLQYNGNTPLRETRISSSKKKTNSKTKSNLKKLGDHSLFTMEPLLKALPEKSNISLNFIESQLEDKVDVEENHINEVITNELTSEPTEEEELEENDNEVFESENENCLQKESTDSMTVNKRESYVIERAAETGVRTKSVTVISPIMSSKTSESNKKRYTNSIRRKGTPIRRSALSSGRKVSTQSIVSRLYSTAKKNQNQYKTMAELLKEFETQPRGFDRSRSVDRIPNGIGSGQRSRSSSVSSLTRPKSPKLQSGFRHRKTPRQTEDIIASQIKKYSFKANPIRKKLFDADFASGIPRVKSSKVPTKAVPMNFLTEKRHELRANKQQSNDKSEDEHKFHFKANPMPAFNIPKILAPKCEKKELLLKPFSFDDRIQQLVTKKRSQSEDKGLKRDGTRNTFKF